MQFEMKTLKALEETYPIMVLYPCRVNEAESNELKAKIKDLPSSMTCYRKQEELNYKLWSLAEDLDELGYKYEITYLDGRNQEVYFEIKNKNGKDVLFYKIKTEWNL